MIAPMFSGEKNAAGEIVGYTICNDISSEGSWHPDLSNWRKKGSDTFGPVGPWIETDVPDPHKLEVITRLTALMRLALSLMDCRNRFVVATPVSVTA